MKKKDKLKKHLNKTLLKNYIYCNDTIFSAPEDLKYIIKILNSHMPISININDINCRYVDRYFEIILNANINGIDTIGNINIIMYLKEDKTSKKGFSITGMPIATESMVNLTTTLKKDVYYSCSKILMLLSYIDLKSIVNKIREDV